MIWASCRRPLGGSVLFGLLRWSGDPIETVVGKRVCVLCHGSKNTEGQLRNLYGEIANRYGSIFDVYVGFVWPAGVTPVAYLGTSLLSIDRAASKLRDVVEACYVAGAQSVSIDAHSLGVPIALEAALESDWGVDGLYLKAGAMPRDLSKYRPLLEQARPASIDVFFSKHDPVVKWLYRLWWPFRGALGAYGESTKGGNIGVQWDCSTSEHAKHGDYRHSSAVVQAATNNRGRK